MIHTNIHKSSFSRRLTRRIVIALTAILLLISAGVLHQAYKDMELMTRAYYGHVADIEDESIEKTLHEIQVAIHNCIVEVEWKLYNPDSVSKALTDKLKLNPQLLTFEVAFEPGYYPAKGRWFEQYAIWRNGKIEVGEIGSATHDYFASDWYRQGMENDQGSWSEPYYDGTAAHMLLCTYSIPLHDRRGRKVGVFGSDLSLERLHEFLKSKDLKNNTEGPIRVASEYEGDKRWWVQTFIVGRKGFYITHPDKERILRDNLFDDLRQSPDTAARRMVADMTAGRKGIATTDIDGHRATVFYTPLEQTGWTLGVILPETRLKMVVIRFCLYLALFLLLGLLTVYAICQLTISRSTRPLKLLAKSADEVATGNFNAPLPDIRYHDEIRQLRDSFGNMQQSLSQYIDELQATTAQKSAYENELSIARDIQTAMLTADFPDHPDIDIYAKQTPAKAVGGDLYDFLLCRDRLYFCIGDVSGKGVPAALVMAMVRSAFQLLPESCPDPDGIVSRMNESMNRHNDLGLFVTLVVGVLHLGTGHLRLCNAGHCPPFVNGKPLTVDSNLPIGVMPDWEYTVQEADLAPGDMLFLHTDGLDEAEDSRLQLFGRQRITDTLLASSSLSPRALIERMTEAVTRFVGGTEQSDDLTMLALQWKK